MAKYSFHWRTMTQLSTSLNSETGDGDAFLADDPESNAMTQSSQSHIKKNVDDDSLSDEQRGYPTPWRHPLRFLGRGITDIFAFVSLFLMLAIVAAVPLLNFYVLGAFLDVEGRLGKSGRFRDGFPLLRIAPRVVILSAGIWFFLLPLRFLASFAADAHLIDPGSAADVGLHVALRVAWVLVTCHLVLAVARGGTFWCFVRPIKNLRWLIAEFRNGGYFEKADRHVNQFMQSLKVREYFWLAIRGFAVAFLWLFLPTALYTIAKEPQGGQILLTIVGGIALAVVLSWAPFLQARFAVERRFAAGFQLREVRQLYAHAPLACSFSVVLLYLLSLPLYLFKAFLLPQDAMWPITFVFVLSIYPTRLVTGWAYRRAERKKIEGKRSHWIIRWTSSGVLIALLGIYVFILFFTQFLGEQGKAVLFHHHALLLPSPF